ncbi:hypothetical protein [Microbacterium enclense]|uniref:hypothetical protein n=1 Tax=Microbacterium enclense TaxID=993073 RepID=UPI003F7EAFAA
MNQTPHDVMRPRRTRRLMQPLSLIAAPLVAGALIAGGLAAAGTVANAATGGVGWGTYGSTATAWKGTFNAGGPKAVCAEAGRPLPTGATTSIGTQDTGWLNANLSAADGTHPSLSDNQTAGINRVLTENVDTGDRNMGAALEYAVRAVLYPNDADLNWAGGHSGSMNAAINFDLYSTAGRSNVAAIQSQAADLINEINSTTAGSGRVGDAGSPSSIVQLASATEATLTINFHGADADATWTDTLHNGIFAATGTDTISGTVGSSQTVTFDVIPRLSDPSKKLTDSGSITAPGGSGGYAANLSVFTTAGGQTSVGFGGQANGSSTTLAWGDPVGLPLSFSPQVSTQTASNYYVEGDTPTDKVTGVLGDTAPEGTSWPTDSNGNYIEVKVEGTLYGPLAVKPTESASVPTGTPVAGRGSVTLGGSTADPTANATTITSDAKIGAAPNSSGYYVWVESVKGADQSASTRTWLTGGDKYAYTTHFGISEESFITPPKVTTSVPATASGVTTSLNGKDVPTQGLGLPVSDTISVTGNVDSNAGMYVIDRHYTFSGTVSSTDGSVTAPTTGNQVCTSDNSDYTSEKIPVTKAGDLTASFNSTKNGAGVWVETLYAQDGTVLTTEADQKAACGNTSEWTAVKQLVVTTQASTSNSGASATDVATIWGTVPAGAQIASVLYHQAGEFASAADQSVAVAGPVGLNGGLVNGVVVTLPAVAIPSGMTKGYFVESVYDLGGKLISQGARGVASESVSVTTPVEDRKAPVEERRAAGEGSKAAGAGVNAAVSLPIISG